MFLLFMKQTKWYNENIRKIYIFNKIKEKNSKT